MIGIVDNMDSPKSESAGSPRIEDAVSTDRTTDEFVWSLDEEANDSTFWIGGVSVESTMIYLMVIGCVLLYELSSFIQLVMVIVVTFALITGVMSQTECALGNINTCCLYEGSIQCWGQGTYGINGNGGTGNLRAPSSTFVDLGSTFIARG